MHQEAKTHRRQNAYFSIFDIHRHCLLPLHSLRYADMGLRLCLCTNETARRFPAVRWVIVPSIHNSGISKGARVCPYAAARCMAKSPTTVTAALPSSPPTRLSPRANGAHGQSPMWPPPAAWVEPSGEAAGEASAEPVAEEATPTTGVEQIVNGVRLCDLDIMAYSFEDLVAMGFDMTPPDI